jgi:tetratricopeptide (TPR) repeat protein
MAKRSKKKARAAPGAPAPKPAKPGWKIPIRLWTSFLQAALIALAGCWAFGPAVHGDWLWDDDFYITQNVLQHDPAWLWKIWFQPGSVVNYFPITATVAWAQWQLWGLDTFGYHLTNIFLHIVSALLIWRLFAKFGLRYGWLGALIFAVHPTCVESVAWISELKNTLSLPPFVLAACAYLDFEESKRGRDYALALCWFFVAMLCKVTMVAFPLVILLHAWWKRGRIGWTDLKASLPFLVIALVLGLLNVVVLEWFQAAHGQIHESLSLGGLGPRLARAGLALSFYFSKAFLPIDLSPMYPRWNVDPPDALQFLPWVVLAIVFYGLWTRRHAWGRHVVLGFGFFLLNLAPFAGFIGNSFMRFTWVMDHFLYLPLIGLIGLVVAAFGQIYPRLSAHLRPFALALTALGVILLAVECHAYARVFRNQETLWTYTTRRYPGAWLAWADLGNVQSEGGRNPEAIDSFRRSLLIKPDEANTHYNLGFALMQSGQTQAAEDQYLEALRLDPNHASTHLNLGNILIRTGRLPDAMEQFAEAVRSDPGMVAAHNNLGNVLRQSGRLPEAIDQYQQALRINPDYVDAHNNLAVALNQAGRFAEAIEQCQLALKIRPDDSDALDNWGIALANSGQISAAMDKLEAAVRIDPHNAQAQKNLAALQALEKNDHVKK